ncbi:hypothetical protein DEU56DRAFT_768682 [Suillus clintonianus]|uniref:uncharacterized protein n=1 Tax=Suillus clintonianus TaxID=1904413 RepID=UPI001B884AF7|nr:uncharacterized protein DEU56DRAFT_768682 [Suillus clintonianus]KAG2155691.1 hypothetical protein DEU56DRAFT_768682 [Suillus clintonianus]
MEYQQSIYKPLSCLSLESCPPSAAMELTMDNVLFPTHPSQTNNHIISASSSVLGDVDPDDHSTVSTPIAPQDDEKPHKKAHDPDSTDKGTATKKPRHRHSPNQLAALNELYEKNEHPSLDDRTELAEKLGMETKTVNAWFQNKRASTKKRNKPAPTDAPPQKSPSSTLPSIANLLNSSPPPPSRNLSSRSHPSSSRKKQKEILLLHDHHISEPHYNHDKSFAPEFLPQDRFVPESQPVDSDRHHAVYAERGHFVPDADSRFVSENDGASDGVTSRKGRGEPARNRTTPEQADELRRAYAMNAHPSKDDRIELAERIGMRTQSVTNWFQNQRTQARKHKEDHHPLTSSSSTTADGSSVPSHPSSVIDDDHGPHLSHLNFPPRASHPSLVPDRHLPLPALPFLKLSPPELDEVKIPRSRMSLPPSSNPRLTSPRIRRSVTPYSRDLEEMPRTNEGAKGEDSHARPRRSRPEPYQLEALKKLLHRTSTPSIEQRNALALEVGMDIGKVTNWFRNIRQTARKRAKRAGVPLPRAPRGRGYQYNFSRETSSGSSSQEEDEDDAMDLDDEDTMEFDIDERSEEDFQEAVTPGMSPSPPPQKRIRTHVPLPMPRGVGVESMGVGLIEPAAFQELEMAVGMSAGPSEYVSADTGMHTTTFSGVKIEDALLLLSFHQHVVH